MTQTNALQHLAAEPLVSVLNVAEQIGCSAATLKRKRLEGDGPPYIKIGNIVRYRPSAVQEWLESCTSGQKPKIQSEALSDGGTTPSSAPSEGQ